MLDYLKYLTRAIAISTAAVIVISICIMVPLFLVIVWHRERILSFFLEIPVRNVRQLYKKCEKYVNNIQDDQGGEDDSNNSESSKDNE